MTIHMVLCHCSAIFQKKFNVWCSFIILVLYFSISLSFVEVNAHHEEPRQDEADHVHHEDEVCYLMLL